MSLPTRHRRALAISSTTLAVSVALSSPALADPLVPPGGAGLESQDRRGSSSPDDLPDIALAPAGKAIVIDRSDSRVAPGVNHTSFDRLDARGWVRGDVLSLDLTKKGVTLDYVNSGAVASTGTLSSQVAGRGAIAAVNGDGFDINDTGAPLGTGVQRRDDGPSVMLNGTAAGTSTTRPESIVVGHNGLARLTDVVLDGSASDGTDTVALTNLNSPNVASNGIALYTQAWGDVAINRTLNGAANVFEVVLRGGVVIEADATVDHPRPAADERVLVARDAGAERLATAFAVGEKVDVAYAPKGADDIAMALNGFFPVARDGQVVTGNDTDLHPRTIVGVNEDGTHMWLVTVDGRQANSRGLTEVETARLLLDMGASDVVNLDGGGSSEMIARTAGDSAPQIMSSPSDGSERHTANSIGLFAEPGSGRLSDFRILATNSRWQDADTDGTKDLWVMEGLTREITAQGHDETYAPVLTTRASLDNGAQGNVRVEGMGTGVLTGVRRGSTSVVARSGSIASSARVVVLGAPVRLSTSTTQVSLPSNEVAGTFQVFGHDREGMTTWIEPRDVSLDYDRSKISVTAQDDRFIVTPLVESGSTVITATAGGRTTELAVTVGLGTRVVDTFDDLTRWTATSFPAVVRSGISTAEGRTPGSSAVALDYSLTGTTATRAAYVTATPRIALSGNPQKLGVWVHGDGRGAWLRANVYEATGGSAKTVNLADKVNWTGWKYVEADIPAGLVKPLTFFRLYVVETAPSRQYGGRVLFDDLTVRSAPEVPALNLPTADDPALITDGRVPPDFWRFGVMSDTQFTADAPNGPLVEQARRSLRELLATEPEFIVINGDFVDRGFAKDIALAKRVIDEEVGDQVPVHYVPGNHEAAGPNNLSEWVKVFGEPARTFDHKGTRFIIRNTYGYSLRSGGFGQVLDLQAQLAAAARDASVRNVVLVQHHPMTDPTPTGGSALTDPKEAEMLQDWLADFRFTSGKGATMIAAGVGTFHASRTDGVLQLISGNSGKGPNGAPGNGGFTGWSTVGIDPNATATPLERGTWSKGTADQWLQVEMTPHVDSLELTAPAHLSVGETTSVTATVVQDGRRVPVNYPVAADWTADPSVTVSEASPRNNAVASFDPESGEFVAHRPGTATVSVTVNGVTEQVSITVR